MEDILYDFYQPLDKAIWERQMLLMPMKYRHTSTINYVAAQEDKRFPTQCTENRDVYKCIHAALQSHDLQQSDEHSCLNVSRHNAMVVVPESLHMFLSVLFDGQDIAHDLLVCVEETEQLLNDFLELLFLTIIDGL